MNKLLDVALTQVGVREDAHHTNHGEAIKYQQEAGLGSAGGYPWCQSFVFWCGHHAYGDSNPVPKTGGVLECWRRASDEYKILKANATPQNIVPGAQFILSFGEGKGHTGFVIEMFSDGSYSTIEGNSNDDGSRDGYEVAKRTGVHNRHIGDASLLGFIIYPE